MGTDFSELLRAAIASGDFAVVGDSYAEDARLDANLVGGRTRVTGREAVTAELSSWWPSPARLLEWSPQTHEHGLAVWFERVDRDGRTDRQRHYLHLRGGTVTRQWAYAARPRASADGGVARSVGGESILAQAGEVVERAPLVSSGWSGNRIERVTMRDGRQLIAKRIVPGADWIGRATGDPGREALLFTEGIFERLPQAIDPATVAAGFDDDGAAWIVMRDVSAELLPANTTIPRSVHRRIMTAANEMWEAFWEQDLPCLAPLERRLALTSPATALDARNDQDLLPHQLEVAWEAFAEAADSDVADAVVALLHDPAPFASAISARGTTLTHGDLRDEQLGIASDRVIALDWGIATAGHPVTELAWYLMHNAWRTNATRDQLVDDFRAVRGDHDDPAALELGYIAGLVMYGWIIGHSAVVHTDPAERAWAREELDWWVPRARRALERSSLPPAVRPPTS